MRNAAIYLHPDGYRTDRERLMGRHSAGESFLRGYIRHLDAPYMAFWRQSALTQDQASALVRGIEPNARPARWIPPDARAALSDPGCVYYPSPTIGPEAWRRRTVGAATYSLCGVTHTTATHKAIDALADLLVSPVEPWDGLICTSAAVRANVEAQLDVVREDLAGRLGATRIASPQLATIPLGVNGADFATDPEQRKAWRERLGIPEDAVAALYVGRLNVQAKMNPALMAQALERTARATGQTIYWIVSGWSATPEAWESFHAATRAFCPSIQYRPVDGRPADTRFSIWSAADLFLSFSDNIQETFGLTPAEAMAAGLPSVVTDWNGYRETVRHGVDGFRIPTLAPRPGLGQDLAFSHDNGWLSYDNYVGAAAQMTAIDMGAAVEALSALVSDPDLRRRMGEAGRRRVTAALDWSAIIPQYQDFWQELAERRAAAGPDKHQPVSPHHPRRLDPFTLFAAYPTATLGAQDRLRLGPAAADWAGAQVVLDRELASVGRWAMGSMTEVEALYGEVARLGECAVADLLAPFGADSDRARRLERSLLWLMKFDLLVLATPLTLAPETG